MQAHAQQPAVRPTPIMNPGAEAAKLLRDSHAAAHAARLRHVSDEEPGYARRRRGPRFFYVTARGKRISDQRELRRIAALAVPPAWQDVWICASPNGHIQATGRDVRGRKQYRYHPRWRQLRDEAKYEDALLFAQALPRLRARIASDLGQPELAKTKVIAAILRIMELTCIRVGNDCYAQDNDSYGLSTLRDQHARVAGATVEFRFRGKGGKLHHASLSDPQLARIVKRCRDIPGQRLFQYFDRSGHARSISSTDINDYIREVTGKPFTAKTVRTWSGTVGAAMLLFESEPCRSAAHARRCVKASIERVAEMLGNTQAICRKCYVHPAVVDTYLDGSLHDHMQRCLALARRRKERFLRLEERAVLALFETLATLEPRRLATAA